jgi:hypothetical protein
MKRATGDFSDKTQFDYLYDALAQKYPGIKNCDGKNTMFQFVTTPIAADWSITNMASAYDLVNSVPANLDGFYVNGASHVDDSVKTLYNFVKPNTGEDIPQYREYLKQYNAIMANIGSLREQARGVYMIWAKQNTDQSSGVTPTFNTWLASDDGYEWNARINIQKTNAANIQAVMNNIIASMLDPQLTEAKSAFNTDTMDVSYPGASAAITVPRVSIDGDLAGDVNRWVSQTTPDFDVRINAQQTITSPWKTTYDTKVTQQCWKTKVDVKVNTSRIINDMSYELRVTAIGLESYPITRGTWYSGSYVNTGVPLIDGGDVSSYTFFSDTGSLHLIPTNILVMYKPEITLTISKDTYTEQLGTYADLDIDWMDVFGFRLDVGVNGKLAPVENGDGTMTITFSSPENAAPQIVGITSQVLYLSD